MLNDNSDIRTALIRKALKSISDVVRGIVRGLLDYMPVLSKGALGRSSSAYLQKRSIFSWQNVLAVFLIIATITSGAATYEALNDTLPQGSNPDIVVRLLVLDLVLLLALVALIARRIVALWSGRRRKLAGSHLHVRLVYIFSVMAAVPAIMMTVFSVFFFHYGIQTWFSERVQTAVNESQEVAEAYLEEHRQVIRADTLAMANDIDRQASMFMMNDGAFEKAVETQSIIRNLSEAIVFDSTGRVLASSGLTFSLEFEEIPNYAMEQAANGEVAVMTGSNDDRVRALIRLSNFIDAYLFVGRMVDPQVLSHLIATKQASQDYDDLQARSSQLQIMVTLIFIVIGLLLMMTAIWLGFVLARQLVTPISDIIQTSDRLRAGDMSARAQETGAIEEFDYLARSFNRMTKQIQEQQGELLETNRLLDRRRRFTETVLAGVTSGVMGVDAKGKINLLNSSAEKLLKTAQEDVIGKKVAKIAPEFGALLEQAHERIGKITQAEIPIIHHGEVRQVFLVRIVLELIDEKEVGAIITFDDITDFQSAQRKAAWADVARRIAHEIKNPLTPIQLSAERLKRKYLSQITEDPATFSQCTDTIIRHVEDIGRMVNEFSSFARMPEPIMKPEHLSQVIEDVLFLQRQAHSEMNFDVRGMGDVDYVINMDAQQMRQALSNLVQNAVDSVVAKGEQKQSFKGSVLLSVRMYGATEVAVIVQDNGLGLPKNEVPSRLTEPYVTHKAKGTGLGLAIVKKIIEDHNGEIQLGASDWLVNSNDFKDIGGATVLFLLPVESVVSLKNQKQAKAS